MDRTRKPPARPAAATVGRRLPVLVAILTAGTALLATAARLAPLTDGSAETPPAQSPGTAPTPPTLRLLTPFVETGRLTAQDATALSQIPLDRALTALSGTLAPLPDCDEPPFSHDCLELSSLVRPAAHDSFDVTHYIIEILEVNETARSFRAVTHLHIDPLKVLSAVDLNLIGVTVTDVRVTFRPSSPPLDAAFVQRDSLLHVDFTPSTRPGLSALDVQVTYQGTNSACTDRRGLRAGMVFTTEGVHTFSEPNHARYWYPCHDVPWDKATFTLILHVPPGRKASASGVLTDSVNVNGQDVMTWVTARRMSTYLTAFYVGDYVKLTETSPGGVPLEYFLYPNLVDKARVDFQNVPDMVDTFSGLFGDYPGSRYAMTLGLFGGGMEHWLNSLIESNFIRGNRTYESVFAHELAHMWFGDLVTPEYWNDTWMKEGFATYCEWLYAEHRYGFDERKQTVALVDTVYKTALANPDSPIKDHPVAEPSPCKPYSWVVYQKGGRVLDMLRGIARLETYYSKQGPVPPDEFERRVQAGDAAFFRVLARVVSEHAYGTVTTADFIQIARSEIPFADRYLAPWLYGLSYPRISLDWTREPAVGADRLRVHLEQDVVPGVPPFMMPVHIRYRSGSQALDEVRYLYPVDTVEWLVNLPPGDWTVEFDPDDWLLDTHGRIHVFTRFTPGYPYPNPSSSGFTFTGELDGSAPADVTVAVYDLQGRRVWETELAARDPGTVQATWDGTRSDGRRAPAGVYFARVQAGSQRFLQRLVVLP